MTAEEFGPFELSLEWKISPGGNSGIIYLVNELLENAIKFRVPGAIRIDCSLEGGNFELTVSNDTAPEVASRFQSLIEEIISRDPGELLIERIEANADLKGEDEKALMDAVADWKKNGTY